MEKYVPLKTVVSYFLDQTQKGISSFDKAWIMAYRGLVVLNQSIAAEPKSVRLPVSANLTVALPSDYVSWSKIGVMNNLGEVCALKVNNGLSLWRDNNPERLADIFPNVSDGFNSIYAAPLFFNYYNNGTYYNLFGVRGGLVTYGDCRVDETNGVIVLEPNFQYSDIILEYISNPQQDNDYMVEGCLQEAIIAFIEWKMKLGTEQAFYARAIEGRRSLTNKRVTLQQINEVIRQTGGQFLKA